MPEHTTQSADGGDQGTEQACVTLAGVYVPDVRGSSCAEGQGS